MEQLARQWLNMKTGVMVDEIKDFAIDKLAELIKGVLTPPHTLYDRGVPIELIIKDMKRQRISKVEERIEYYKNLINMCVEIEKHPVEILKSPYGK